MLSSPAPFCIKMSFLVMCFLSIVFKVSSLFSVITVLKLDEKITLLEI